MFAAVASICCATSAAGEQAARLDFFESKIRPVLVEHCYRCHSEESGKSKGGLLLDSRAGWQVGGESGPAIVPGDPAGSLLIKAIGRSGVIPEMPPKSNLPDQVIRDFERWIADGAVDPREGEAPVHDKETIDIEEGRQFWSFQPRAEYSRSQTIDGLVQPAAAVATADRLVRRLFLDLVGLPPTSEEREAFRRAYREQSPATAVSTFADQLLARTEFGEKWARHWLDVARYADSNGGDFNLTFPQSWRYRNYVIDAFNADMPYDQFLREQIAGDLLPAESPTQANRQLVATGFLMVAPKMLTERDKAKMHLDIADEQVDTIGRAIMGMTLGCARCHDHKFDPIPTADYYALAGIFHSTRTADGILMGNVNVSGWTETELVPSDETRERIAAHEAAVRELQEQIAGQKKLAEAATKSAVGIVVDDDETEQDGPWRKSTYRPNHVGDHYLAIDKGKGPFSITWKTDLPEPGKYELRVSFGGGSGLAKKARYLVRHAGGETQVEIDQTVRPSIRGLWFPIGQFEFDDLAELELAGELAKEPVIADAVQLVSVKDLEIEAEAVASLPGGDVKALEQELKTLKANAPKLPKAMAAKDHAGERLGDLQIRIRGEIENLGAPVPRGFLQVASSHASASSEIPHGQSGRLQLADWLTHPDHPLTARVMANRIWQHLLGRGIVPTSDNFGMRGAPPSKPELLDHLAGSLVANGWSMKSLIREIVNSRTYQQSAQTATEADPDNQQLRHQNRRPAPAETIRDSILAIAGELDRQPRESVVSQLGMYAIQTSGKRDASLGQTGQLRQRSIYMPIVRGAVPPSLAVFDLPNPDLVTGTRPVTTVPAQALFMMNSPFVREMAGAVAEAFSDDGLAVEEIVRQLYLRILVRDAHPDEIALGQGYISGLVEGEGKSRRDAVASLVQVLFSSTEFRFIE